MSEKNSGAVTTSRTLVMKFGGTSVGSTKAMQQVTEITRQTRLEWPRLVIVVSALAGVTDLLLSHGLAASKGDTSFDRAAQELRRIHLEIADTLVTDLSLREQVKQNINHLISEFTNLCQAIVILGEATPRALDAVASLGERLCVRLLAAILESNGIPCRYVEATQLIVTDEQFQSAHPDFRNTQHKTRQVLGPMLDRGVVPIVTGFIGATPAGITTTLGRGGSDYSAAIIGAALPADEVWIWTDVDGVMTTDPRLVPEARTIQVLSYREVSELAYFGAKVLHPKTIRPVIEAGIGLRVCNTFNPSHPGTRLVVENGSAATGVIKAVTTIRGLQLITVEGRGMLGVPGVAARTFGAVAATQTSVPLISQASSEQSICFTVPAESTHKVIAALEAAFAHELANQDIDRIWATEEVGIITVVGAGMKHTPGIAGRVFSALGSHHINIIAIAQGSSEVSISMVVDAQDIQAGVRALHQLIIQ